MLEALQVTSSVAAAADTVEGCCNPGHHLAVCLAVAAAANTIDLKR